MGRKGLPGILPPEQVEIVELADDLLANRKKRAAINEKCRDIEQQLVEKMHKAKLTQLNHEGIEIELG